VSTVARFQGSQTGYTQGSIVLHSGTADSPSSRGQGTYRYNEGTDICWYTGTAYSDTNKYIWARRTGITSFATDAGEGTAQAGYALMTLVGSSGNVGIGTTSPDVKLHVYNGSNGATTVGTASNELILENDTDCGLTIRSGASSTGVISFASPTDHNVGQVYYDHADNSMTFKTNDNIAATINSSGNVGIGLTNPSQKLEVTGNFKLNGTLVQEGTGNNITYKYRTANSSLHSGGNALVKFGRLYWTPAHWVTGAPVIKVTLHCKYYQGERREYIIKAGYGDTNPVINELQPSSTGTKIGLLVGTTTSAGYNYAGQPVYYADLQWVQTAYIWGWAQVESQVAFLGSNPTSGWGGVVMDSTVSQNNNAGAFTNYTSFFAGNIKVPSTYSLTTGTAANMHVDSNGIFYRSTSSLKYKKEVRNYDKGLNEVMQLQPKYYKGEDDGDIQFAGLIAEDVHDLGLTEFVQYADDGSPDALSYSHMIALLTKSIQEVNTRIKSRNRRIKEIVWQTYQI